MGLAGPRKRVKISHDPNNTEWTHSTTKFGHRILTSQGWSPGDYLGAKDSSHAKLHTKANAAPIRVSFKDDNLGLGARIGGGTLTGQCVGLDAYQNLLGRLNDKGEQVLKAEAKVRSSLRCNEYLERRWGSLSTIFVNGGMLDEDEISKFIKTVDVPSELVETDDHDGVSPLTQHNACGAPAASNDRSVKKLSRKKARKGDSKARIPATEVQSSSSVQKDLGSYPIEIEDVQSTKKSKKSKKKQKKKHLEAADESSVVTTAHQQAVLYDEFDQRSRDDVYSQPEARKQAFGNPRHVLRGKHIKQKRLATSDAQSLNEILMLKTPR